MTSALKAQTVYSVHLQNTYTTRFFITRTSVFKVKNTADPELNVMQFGWCKCQYCTQLDYCCDNQDCTVGTRFTHKLNQ